MKRICVIGLGYIGLPTASMFASRGFEVIGVDINPDVVQSVNAGRAHFKEPDLEMLTAAAVQTGRLTARTDPVEADLFIIAVPTPFADEKKPDMSYVMASAASIAPVLKNGDCIILESTSPVGTTQQIADLLSRLRPDLSLPTFKEAGREGDVGIAHCPERILPGQMVRELVSNDRIIGGMTERCAEMALAFYQSFVMGRSFLTDCRTAEFVKLIENSYRDVNIAFANELSLICERLNIDVWDAIGLANRHPRVNILRPGPGVGGHCIAVDPWFIVDSAPQESVIIRTAREVNLAKTEHVVARIKKTAARFRNPVVACFGLTYKPDVDDLRESPAVEIVEALFSEPDIQLLVCEPMVTALPPRLEAHGKTKLVPFEVARREADILVFLVGHNAFKGIDAKLLLNKIVIDTVGLLQESDRSK